MLRELSPTDRRIALFGGVVAAVVLGALATTGMWQLVTTETNPRWLDSYSPGFGSNRGTDLSVGEGNVHGDLGDVAAVVVLLSAAWFSFRVIFRISWLGVGALGLTIGALVTGGLNDISATVSNGKASAITNGYAQIFGRDVDVVITDRYELGATTAQLLTVTHALATPALVFMVWLAWAKARKRPHTQGRPSWLDQLDDRPSL